MKKFLDDFLKGSTPFLYYVVILGFSATLALALPIAARFIVRQFLLRWSRTGGAARAKMTGVNTEGVLNTDSANHGIPRNVRDGRENEAFSPLRSEGHRIFPDDSPFAGRQNSKSGLHPGAKTFFLLKSKNPICDTANWIALL